MVFDLIISTLNKSVAQKKMKDKRMRNLPCLVFLFNYVDNNIYRNYLFKLIFDFFSLLDSDNNNTDSTSDLNIPDNVYVSDTSNSQLNYSSQLSINSTKKDLGKLLNYLHKFLLIIEFRRSIDFTTFE